MSGWIKLHRKIEDNPLWFNEPFTKGQAWVDLILFANHKKRTIQIRGNFVDIGRGQLGWSELTMAKRWQWSRNKVRRFLNYLETIQQIEQQKDRFITTIITILNYEDYQKEQQTIQQKDSRRYINNNVKNNIYKYILVELSKIFDFPLRENKTAYKDLAKLIKRFGDKKNLLAFARKAKSFKEYPYVIESPGSLWRKLDKIEARLKIKEDIEKDKMYYGTQEVKRVGGKLKVKGSDGNYLEFGGHIKDIINYKR